MEKKYRKGEIVWAKVRGFPWWPAVVKGINLTIRREESENTESESKETTIIAYFIGDDTHSELPVNKIEKFAQKLEEYSRTKKRSLLTSIAIAKKILSGEIPFEKHLEYAKKRNLKLFENKHEETYKETSEIYKRPKLMLGKKRRLEKPFKKMSPSPMDDANTEIEISSSPKITKTTSPTQIDFKVKEDISKNIKINININVNNNTSNTLNITTIGKKIEDSSFNMSEESSEEEDPLETLKEQIESLLFYKIDMPATSRDRSILSTLDKIQSRLSGLKNCNVFNLFQNLISVLTSFLSHKNSNISNKSNELISFIREKILSEIFEFENVPEEMARLLQQGQLYIFDQDFKLELKSDLEKNNKHNNTNRENLVSLSRKESLIRKESLPTRTSRQISEEIEEDIFSRKICASDYTKQNFNNIYMGNSINTFIPKKEFDNQIKKEQKNFSIPKNTNKSTSMLNPLIAINKNKLPSLDDGQIRLLFKDFITDDMMDNSHFRCKLQNGIYGQEFYQTVYNKYNGLSESLANKRKHVCLKLLNILKLILPAIDTETLKKTIIFLEYSIRTKDPTLGNIYRKKLEGFYDRIKEILSLTTESLNMNNLNNININVKTSSYDNIKKL